MNVVSQSMIVASRLVDLIAGTETVKDYSNQVGIIECGILECGELLTESRNDNFLPTQKRTRDPESKDADDSKMGRW